MSMSARTLLAESNLITAQKLLEHISTLASDRFEGRAPGTTGETLTLEYLSRQCERLGLAPAGDVVSGKPTYLQAMPVTGIKMQSNVLFKCDVKEQAIELKAREEVVARSAWWEEKVEVDSQVVFVGYGIVAPEYAWDDYKDVSVRGKTVVMLIGDPEKITGGVRDESFFKGKALTYHGRWTYKYEMASKMGAAAVLIVHDTDKAGYGWDVVQASWGQESFGVGQDPNWVRAEGWLAEESACKIFAMGGHDFDSLKLAAQTADFYPVELGITSSIKVQNQLRPFTSHNVVAKWEGSDPALKEECIVYCAHWDHFGKTVRDGKTEILSGALDNGSGMAVCLEIARALTAIKERPRRSIIFLFPTLEEHGLLGARHYVQHPAVPMSDTVAIINFDIMNPWGRTRNLISVARGHSSMDEVIEELAGLQGRTMGDDLEPDKGYFFRSDHLEFLRRGVPALFFLNPGDDFIGKPKEYALERRIEYLTQCYHKPADKVNPDWELSGMVEDAQLLLAVGLAVANDEERPEWKNGSEFKQH